MTTTGSQDSTSLRNKFLALKQDANQTGQNTILSEINLNIIDCVERLSKHDEFASNIFAYLNGALVELNLDHSELWLEVRQNLFEFEAYLKFCGKTNIEKVQEQAQSTPDFVLTFNDDNNLETFFIECKSLAPEAPSETLRTDQGSSLEAMISLEEQRREGREFCVAESWRSPYRASRTVPDNCIRLIDSIQSKLDSNLKQEQLKNPKTILFLDLGLWPLHEDSHRSIRPFLYSENHQRMWNGSLWILCCGSQNMPVFSVSQYGILRYDGIFKNYSEVKAVIFRCSSDTTMNDLVAIVRDEEHTVKNLLEYMGITWRFESNNHDLDCATNMI